MASKTQFTNNQTFPQRFADIKSTNTRLISPLNILDSKNSSLLEDRRRLWSSATNVGVVPGNVSHLRHLLNLHFVLREESWDWQQESDWQQIQRQNLENPDKCVTRVPWQPPRVWTFSWISTILNVAIHRQPLVPCMLWSIEPGTSKVKRGVCDYPPERKCLRWWLKKEFETESQHLEKQERSNGMLVTII